MSNSASMGSFTAVALSLYSPPALTIVWSPPLLACSSPPPEPPEDLEAQP